MFKGIKKGSDGPNERRTILAVERLDVLDDGPEMILNPRASALCAAGGRRSTAVAPLRTGENFEQRGARDRR